MAEEEKNEVQFPYLQKIHVNDCFAYQDFDIEVFGEGEKFKHLILTGKNGSGKTTILRSVDAYIRVHQNGLHPFPYAANKPDEEAIGHAGIDFKALKRITTEFKSFKKMSHFSGSDYKRLLIFGRKDLRQMNKGREWYYLFAHFPAIRQPSFNEVHTAKIQEDYDDLYQAPETVASNFRQFLVNKRVRQAFHQISNNEKEVESTEKFFNQFEGFLKRIYTDPDLKFVFADEEFEFYIHRSNGQKFTLDQMSDGYSAFLWILMDLVARTDIIRKLQKNLDYDPPGIVLIDEPELHLHLELQYEVLPMLTQFFPNVQFIVATHSPAVISSIENATVYDLTTQSVAPNYTPGSSFSELMMSHFGLDNEFGPVADKLLDEAKTIIESAKEDPTAADRLSKLLDSNADILTPTLKVKLEAAMRRIKMS